MLARGAAAPEVRPDAPVALFLTDEDGSLSVEVVDEGPYDAAPIPDEGSTDLLEVIDAPAEELDDFADGLPSGVVLAVISGLVDAVTISPGPVRGTRVHMQWPAGRIATDTQSLSERALDLDLPV